MSQKFQEFDFLGHPALFDKQKETKIAHQRWSKAISQRFKGYEHIARSAASLIENQHPSA